MVYRTRKSNKYGAKRTYASDGYKYGYKYDSKFEASIAEELILEQAAGNILGFDRQFRVDMYAYSKCGTLKMKKSHKVDFRVHNLDGTFTLLDVKEMPTQDWKDRVKWLNTFWLPLNPDHDYVVWV